MLSQPMTSAAGLWTKPQSWGLRQPGGSYPAAWPRVRLSIWAAGLIGTNLGVLNAPGC